MRVTIGSGASVDAPAGDPIASGGEDVKSFTSWKFDLINSMLIDPRLKPSDFRVAVAILQFLNSNTGRCNPAQGTLAELLNVDVRTVENCVARLKAAGWLGWKRTRRSNWYFFRDEHVNAMLDRRISIDDARRERLADRLTRTAVPIRVGVTRTKFPVQTRTDFRVQTRTGIPPNT